VVSFTPQPLYPQGKIPCYPLDRRLGGLQSRSGRGGEEKNFQPPPGIEPLNSDRPARSPPLYRLSYHGSIINIRGKLMLFIVKYNSRISKLNRYGPSDRGSIRVRCKISCMTLHPQTILEGVGRGVARV
jgi:hypothetical protein